MKLTQDQINSFNEFQRAGWTHPFTCGTKEKHECKVDEDVLVARENGLSCPSCDFTQIWCHDWMLDWSWKALNPFAAKDSLAVMKPETGMVCPSCQKGTLRQLDNAIEFRVVLRITGCGDKARILLADDRSYEHVGGDPYIGCTVCDFMGSAVDVADLTKPAESEEPRYIGYEVRQPDGNPDWELAGRLRTAHGVLRSEPISYFSEEPLALAMLYRLTGIKGVSGQWYYPLKGE